jgi:cytochrome c-type biogenesis protein CcsB
MSKAISTPVTEGRPASAGTWILLIVSVVVATLIAISVPRLVAEGGWVTGEKFLYLTLIGYLGASAFYLSALVTRDAAVSAAATALMRGSFLLHTTAVVVRWAASGQPPFSNIFEMVLMFAWGVVGFQIFAEWNMKLRFLGAVTLPVAALSLILLQVMPGEVRPLVPALQSTWLHIHVSLAVLSYAGFTLAFAAGVLYFVKDGASVRTFLNWTAGIVTGIYATIVLTSVNSSWAFLLPAWDASAREKILMGPKEPLLVAIPGLGWPFLFATALALAALVLSLAETLGSKAGLGNWAKRFFQISVAAQAAALVLFVVKIRSGPYLVPQFGRSFDVHFASSPFLLAGMTTALFASAVWLVLNWKHEPIVEHLPARETLDNLIYKTIAISFPLLTMMIIAGAYWANKTWGAYWSWDPKEDWALITWLTYAAYLHMRLTRGWRGRRAAYMAIIGFAVVLFTFFGVTYLLPGLHAYA